MGTIVAALAVLDQTLRRFIVDALHGEFPPVLAGVRVHSLTKPVTDVLPMDNTSFLAFGVAALVLVVIMVRT